MVNDKERFEMEITIEGKKYKLEPVKEDKSNHQVKKSVEYKYPYYRIIYMVRNIVDFAEEESYSFKEIFKIYNEYISSLLAVGNSNLSNKEMNVLLDGVEKRFFDEFEESISEDKLLMKRHDKIEEVKE